MTTNAKVLHENAIIIDAVAPLLDDPNYIELYRKGGITITAPTVGGGWDSTRSTIKNIATWTRYIKESQGNVVLVRTAEDVRRVKREKKIGVFMHLQGAEAIEDDLNLVEVYKTLGVGVIQLCYNVRNRVGDGYSEPDNAGLSIFGENLVKRLNENKIIVDCSHTGLRTSLKAIEVSSAPVILSHCNSRAVHDNKRNVVDELIKAIADNGGVIGAVGFPGFVSESTKPTLEQMIAHIDHTVQLVGNANHVSLGMDYYWGQAGIVEEKEAQKQFKVMTRDGLWNSDYPTPPHWYPEGIETPDIFEGMTEGLVRKGYSEQDIRKILGENLLRVMEKVWG